MRDYADIILKILLVIHASVSFRIVKNACGKFRDEFKIK